MRLVRPCGDVMDSQGGDMRDSATYPTLYFRAFYAARLASLNIVGQGSTLLGLFRESSLDSKYEGKVASALLIELE